VYDFGTFEFTTDLFKNSEGQEIVNKIISLEFLETFDIKEPQKRQIVGRTQFTLKDALSRANEPKSKVRLFIADIFGKFLGKMEIANFSARRYFTFFDLIFKNQLNLVPIIGIDFSMANLTMTDASVLHTLKPGAPNDYVEALKGVE
jgi:hypothetical protein